MDYADSTQTMRVYLRQCIHIPPLNMKSGVRSIYRRLGSPSFINLHLALHRATYTARRSINDYRLMKMQSS